MSKRKSRAELEAEISLHRRLRGSGAIASVLNNLIRWAGAVCIAYWIYRSIACLAGSTTTANIGLSVIGDVKLSDVFGMVFGGSGVAYGLAQRRLRRKAIKNTEERIKELESRIDPGRTSSGLTSMGDTDPRDV